MRTLILQQTPDEGPGTLIPWLERVRFPFHVHHYYREEKDPTAAAYDWLVVLGGPMNVDEIEAHPWLLREKDFLSAWIKSGKPVLGICLGGQLLSQALGGAVTKNEQREVGFRTIERTGAEHPALRRWPHSLPVFSLHEDRFSLPEGARSLLTNEATAHQAFAHGERLLGLQFHPEATADWIHTKYGVIPPPREEEPYVQSHAACEAELAAKLPPLTHHFHQLLEDFVESAR